MLNVVLGICGAILLVLMGVVVYSDSHSPNNRWLGVFLGSTLGWLVANLLTNVSASNTAALFFARASLLGAALVPAAYLMFCYSFTHSRQKFGTKRYLLTFFPIAILFAIMPTKLNVISVSAYGASFQPGIAYTGLLVVAGLYFTIGTGLLAKEYKRASATRQQQLYYILLGTILTLLPVATVSAILPLFGYSEAASFGPVFVIFFAAFTTYAIVKHRLFDVRLIIARSLGYTASLVLLASLYGAIVFGVARFIFGLHFSIAIQVYLSAATGIAGLSFQRFQKVFDSLSSRLFYRDAYDTQGFLDQFNKVLVSSFEINSLLKKSSAIIESNLKASYCAFVIHEAATAPRRIITSHDGLSLSPEAVTKIRADVPSVGNKLTLTLNLADDRHGLKNTLRQNNVDVIARLSTSSREEGIGYLILGHKKSGNPYSSQDIKVVEIIANELVIAVQNALHTEEIENFNLTLQAKVDDATRKLRRTNEKLKTLDETKDDFISMASHQLRTPLTSIKGYLSMVLEGDAGKVNETQAKMLGQAFVSSQRMVYLIADLLNVSRLKTGKFVIEAAPTNLAKMVNEEIDQLVETAAGKQIELTFKQPKVFPDIMLDETKTRQVIMNFMDNAIYYTPSGGHIRVELVDAPTSVELRVVDDGIGVPAAEQHHLFTKFYRAGNARKARPDGTGLGLFMAKKVVIAQGGSVIFQSREGKGSTFGFLFPKHSGHAVAKLPVVPEKVTSR